MESNQHATRPNVVLILVDDMGYSDIGCYGSEIHTPNLDRLANRGVRFSQMYNCARCCPTRASLLTGLYPHQAGIGNMVGDMGVGPAYQGYLRDDCVTLAEVLGAAGYRTLMSGKWHVGGGYAANHPETWAPGTKPYPIPTQRGFDEYYGMLSGGGSYFNPPYMMRGERLVYPAGPDYYLTDDISEQAVRMIRETARETAGATPPAGGAIDGEKQPFFLYVAYTAPHWPLHAMPEDIARYEGRYRQGWDALRSARHEELKGLGVLDPKWPISPRDEKAPPFDDLDPARRDWEDLRMAVYAAQVDRMDQGVGRILDELRRLRIEDDTIVMFLSDNGGCAEFLAEDTNKPEPFRYNIPTWDGRPMTVGNIPGLRPGSDTTFMSYDLPWANASNSPFRMFKHWVHEGGISTPFIVHWPAGLGTQPRMCHSQAHVMDIMATLVEVTGAPYPQEHHGTAIQPLEGESFLPALRGSSWQRERPLFWEHHGNRAVRDGQWKLVQKEGAPWELHEMEADRTEVNDLAAAEPGRAQDLHAMYDEWARRCGVLTHEEIRAIRQAKR